jgi:hypothetical protein
MNVNRLYSHKDQADIVNKLNKPSGCARTSKPKTSAIDLEIQETLRKQQDFDTKIQQELQKLNFPINSFQKIEFRSLRKKKRHRTEPTSPKSMSSRAQTVPPQTKSHPKPLIRLKMKPNYLISSEALPPLIKSTPIHLDPNLKFSKKVKPPKKPAQTLEIIAKMNLLIKNFKDYNNNANPDNCYNLLKESEENCEIVCECIQDLVESGKYGYATEKFEDVVENISDNKKLDKKFIPNCYRIRDELAQGVAQIGIKPLLRHRKSSI